MGGVVAGYITKPRMWYLGKEVVSSWSLYYLMFCDPLTDGMMGKESL